MTVIELVKILLEEAGADFHIPEVMEEMEKDETSSLEVGVWNDHLDHMQYIKGINHETGFVELLLERD